MYIYIVLYCWLNKCTFVSRRDFFKKYDFFGIIIIFFIVLVDRVFQETIIVIVSKITYLKKLKQM